jgi:hypothetical protein
MPSQRSVLIEIHDNNLDPKQEHVLVKDKLVLKSDPAQKKVSKKQSAKKVVEPVQAKVEPVVEVPVVVEEVKEESKQVVEEQPAKKLFGKQPKAQTSSVKEDEKEEK